MHFLTIFNLVFGYVTVKVSAKAIRTQIDERMLDISNTAAAMVNGDDVPYEDEWGEFYSSYSPVFDSAGDVAGIVAVDFSAQWYWNKLKQMIIIVSTFMAFALICSVTLAIIITSQYQKFFYMLINRMNSLSDGIETLIEEVSLDHSDEEHSSFISMEGDRGMSDAIGMLEEKICAMQLRLSEQIEIIRSHAYIDGLTGMNNRSSYMEYLQILEKKIEENPDLIFSVVVFDINQLKIINDDFGHETGDKLIFEISEDIREAFGGNRIYRVGGDEFVAILDDPDPSERIMPCMLTRGRSTRIMRTAGKREAEYDTIKELRETGALNNYAKSRETFLQG